MMKISYLLFDMDKTLLDFDKASKQAFQDSFAENNLPYSDSLYSNYQTINSKVWKLFEKGEIDSIKLRSLRFSRFFEVNGIQSIDPMTFNGQYLTNLVKNQSPYPGAIEVLDQLRGSYRKSIITNGLKEAQRPIVERLNLHQYFEKVIVSDEIGVAKPDKKFFEITLRSILDPPAKESLLVIGDNLNSDIQGGINFGIKTCWINHGKTNNTSVKPDFEIQSVHQLPDLLNKLR